VPAPRAAGRATLAALCRLPHACLVFETDSPDQPFMRTLPGAYLAWTREVFEGGPDAGAGTGSGMGAGSNVVATVDDADEEWRVDAPADAPADAGQRAGCCGAEAPDAAAENRPSYVRHIVRAAAIFRVAHGSCAAGEPMKGPGRGGKKARGLAAAFGLDFLAQAPRDVPPEVSRALRAEFASLVRESHANVCSLFALA
jgi:hypothetical protein